MHRMDERTRLLFCIIAPITMGILTGLFNCSHIYKEMNEMSKPPLTAPTAFMVFLWILVYLSVGLATFLVLGSHKFSEEKFAAIATTAGLIVLHSVWVFVYFNLGFIGFAFLLHILIMLLAFVTAVLYLRMDQKAGFLMMPFVVMAVYVTYLNMVCIFIN